MIHPPSTTSTINQSRQSPKNKESTKHLLNPMILHPLDPLFPIPSSSLHTTANLLQAQKSQFNINPIQPIAVLESIPRFVTKHFVHFLECQAFGFGDEKPYKCRAEETHCAEEDEGAVAHFFDH